MRFPETSIISSSAQRKVPAVVPLRAPADTPNRYVVPSGASASQ